MREAEAPALLATREPALRTTEIARLDPGQIDTTGRVHDYGEVPDLTVPAVLAYPAPTVRRYEGVVHLPKAPIAWTRPIWWRGSVATSSPSC